MPMTVDQLFEATGDLYLLLMRPRVGDVEFESLLDLLKSASLHCESDLAREMIQTRNWRTRLLAFALTALLRDDSMTKDIAETFSHPTGLSIVPAGAFLIAHHATSPETFPSFDFSRFDRSKFDGELGWT